MAYPHHFLFAFGGTLLNNTEIWTNTIRFVNTGEPGEQYELDTLCTELTEATATAFTSPITGSLGYSNAVFLKWGKLNAIGPDGKYSDANVTNVHDLPGGGVSGAGTPDTYAPQVSLAVSWATARQRGRASKGRIYVPMPTVAPGTSGYAAPASVLAVSQGWARHIESLNDVMTDSLGNGPLACVVSGVDASFEPITHVRVGNVLDTMRSRRNALTESYQTVEVA